MTASGSGIAARRVGVLTPDAADACVGPFRSISTAPICCPLV
jgi:hypothetical protein